MSEEAPARPTRRGRGDEMIVITRAYDLALEVTERVRKFPRDLRFVLGDRMLSTVLDVLDSLIEARYTSDRGQEQGHPESGAEGARSGGGRAYSQRAPLLRAANLGLERLRFQMRLAADLHLLSIPQYEQMADRIREVGRMVGGWTKASG